MTTRKLLRMAMKWKNLGAISRKRIDGSRTRKGVGAHKGHCVVYTTDKKRFVIPLTYLNEILFRELLQKAEEEYGLPSNLPITLPCNAAFMHYVIYLIGTSTGHDLEKALLKSMHSGQCSTSSCFQIGQRSQNLPVLSF